MRNNNIFGNLKFPFVGSLAVHGLVFLSLGTVIFSKEKPEMEITPIEIVQVMEEPAPESETTELSSPPETVQVAALPFSPPPMVEEVAPPPPEPEPMKKAEEKPEPVIEPEIKKEPEPIQEVTEEVEEEVREETSPPEPVVASAPAPVAVEEPMDTVPAPVHPVEHFDHVAPTAASTAPMESGGAAHARELYAMQVFKKLVRERIEKAKFYPQVARRRGYEGAVGVRFTIQSDGGVEDVEIVAPCHCDILNKAACNAVKKAAPYSPVPDSVKGPVRMEINLAYRLK